jgi:hypothetical protein
MKLLHVLEAYAKKKNVYRYILIILFYLVIIFLFYPGLFLNFSTMVPHGHHGDVKNILGIISFSIHSPLNHIYHLPIFYPESYVLTRTHPLFGISLVFKLFDMFGLNIQQSNNLYILLSLIIGALGCFLLSKEFSNNSFLPLIFSTVYIFHFWNLGHFAWLNFLSHFYTPYVFLFFVRFFKTKKKIYIVLASVLTVFQFFSSIYYGVHLYFFLIPFFLIAAAALKLVSFRDFLKLALALGIGLIFIIWVFFPYISIDQHISTKSSCGPLINGGDFFSYSKIFLHFFSYPEKISLNLFPGFTFFLFPILFIVSGLKNKKIKAIMFIVLLILITLMSYLAFFNVKILNRFFVIFLILIFTLAIINWKTMTKWEKLILLTFSFYTILFINFQDLYFFKNFSFLEFFNTLLPFSGLRNIRRVYLNILPFLIILAAIGGNKFLESFGHIKKKKMMMIPIVILCFMIVENIPLPLPITHSQLMKPLTNYNLKVYQYLPFRKNKIILELPFYFKLVTRNSIFLLNWQFHQNYLLNGKTSIKPHRYFKDLENTIGRSQRKFPNEPALKALIQKYSVNYIIFHWDLLSRYQHNPNAKEKVMQKIISIYKYGKVVYNDAKTTVLKIQEYIPIHTIVRTYSWYHLKKNSLEVILKNSFSGKVRIFLNNRFVEKRDVASKSVKIILNAKHLNVSQNRIELQFEKPVMLDEIKLEKIGKR